MGLRSLFPSGPLNSSLNTKPTAVRIDTGQSNARSRIGTRGQKHRAKNTGQETWGKKRPQTAR
ncbi:MAG: hypothetical protein BM562_04605 [Alphaproteobacteria bacterium MedPE-SWcel]|nr:MAG: hypothetical protein BM562_04605 [Alphaproteobacteria bacterium MedPE-SWcel]